MYRLAEFVLDPQHRLLLRGDERVELARKPYSILLFLVENRDRLVTRRELIEHFWDGKEVYDQTLTRAIARIRSALGDSREEPRFLETRWATGYRYVGPFEEAAREIPGIEPQPIALPAEDSIAALPIVGSEMRHVSPAARSGLASRAPVAIRVAVPAALAAALAVTMILFARHQVRPAQKSASAAVAPQSLPRFAVAVLTFRNLPGNADADWLGTALAEMLSTDLAGDSRLRILPGDEIARASRELGIDDVPGLPNRTLQSVNRDLHADFVVTGSYVVLESDGGRKQVRIDVKEQDARSGEMIAAFSENGELNTLFDLAASARSRLLIAMKLSGDVNAEDASARIKPTAPEVLKDYMDGLQNLRSENFATARQRLESAIAQDGSFPFAHVALADLWRRLGYQQKEQTELKIAASLTDDLGREQSLAIHARYSASRGDWDQAIQNDQALFTFFPDNVDYGVQLSHAQTSAGKTQDAEATLAALRRLPAPLRDDPNIDLAEAAAAQAESDAHRTVLATQRAMDKAKSSGAMLLYAHALSMQAGALASTDIEASLRESRQACEICAAFNDPECSSNILRRIGIFKVDGDPAGATKDLSEALRLARRIGNRNEEDNDLNGLAAILSNESEFESADRMYREVLRHAREDNSGWGIQMAMNNLGNDLLAEGKVEEARKMQEGALVVSQRIGLKEAAAFELMSLAQIDLVEGDLRSAEARARQARDAFKGLNSPYEQALAESLLGDVEREGNNLELARRHEMEATAVLTKGGDGGNLAEARLTLASLTLDAGQSNAAMQLATQAATGLNRQSRFTREGCAHALLALALTETRRYELARKEIKRGLDLTAGKQDRLSSLQVQIDAALLAARTPGGISAADLEGASRRMSQLSAEAQKYRMELPALRAKLAYAELEARCGRSQESQRSAAQAEHTAREYGYLLLADQSLRLAHHVAAAESMTPSAKDPSIAGLRSLSTSSDH